MTRSKYMVMLAVAGLMVGLGFSTPHAVTANGSMTALADPRPSPVLSVEVNGGQLILKASGESLSLDGTYKNSNGQWVKFANGKAVTILGKNNRKAQIQSTKVLSGMVVFVTDSGEILLGNGQFEEQNPTQPREPEPQPQPTAFEVQDGKIVKVWILISSKT